MIFNGTLILPDTLCSVQTVLGTTLSAPDCPIQLFDALDDLLLPMGRPGTGGAMGYDISPVR